MSTLQMILLSSSLILFLLGLICLGIARKKFHTSMKATIAAALLVAFIALCPIYFLKHQDARGGFVDSVLLTLLSSMHALSQDNAVYETRKFIFEAPPSELQGASSSVLSDMPEMQNTEIANTNTIQTSYFEKFLLSIAPIYLSLLHFIAFILFIGLFITFFRNLSYKIKYYSSFGQLCVFAEVSERSYLLAKDIRNKEKLSESKDKKIIVFLNTENEEEHPLISHEDLHKLDALFFNTDACSFKVLERFFLKDYQVINLIKDFLFIKQNKCTQNIFFFLLDIDDAKNLETVIKLSEKYNRSCKLMGKIVIHFLSDQSFSEAISDSIEENTNLKLRLIKESRAIFYDLFDKRPLFLARRGNALKILVVGGGRNGLEAVKIASWCGQTSHLRPHILVVDENPKVNNKFMVECPELAPQNALEFAKNEALIEFYNYEINSPEFYNFLKENSDIGYVIVALGNDEINLEVSIKIRSIFEEKPQVKNINNDVLPLINTLLNNNFFASTAAKLKFDLREECFIYPIGNLVNRYTWDSIVLPYFAYGGQAVNRFYSIDKNNDYQTEKVNADKNYENKEYNRASSVAAAVHAKSKVYSSLCELSTFDKIIENRWIDISFESCQSYMSFDWGKRLPSLLIDAYENALNSQSLEALGRLEHIRWNAYTRSLGWQGVSIADMEKWYSIKNNHRNFSARLHPCLTTWEGLEELDKWFEENTGARKNFQEIDKRLVENLPKILYEARKLDFIASRPLSKENTYEVYIGVTGHRKPLGDLSTISANIKNVFDLIKNNYSEIFSKSKEEEEILPNFNLNICSCLSEGADRLVAKAGLEMQYPLYAFIPFPIDSELQARDLKGIEQENSRYELKKLANKSKSVNIYGDKAEHIKNSLESTKEGELARHQTYLESGISMLEKSDVIIALWNGIEDTYQGSTYDIVSRARRMGKVVYWIKTEKE